MDGFELIRRIRQWSARSIREMPAAALTAYARSEDRQRSLRSGFQMHLAKPIDPEELVAAVAALSAGTRVTRRAADTDPGIDANAKGIDNNPETPAQRRGPVSKSAHRIPAVSQDPTGLRTLPE